MVSAQTQPKYDVQGESLIPPELEASFPKLFQLRNDELGRDAVRLMNDRFKGRDYATLNISGLREGQPIGYSNSYRRWALGPIVRELMGNDVVLLTPDVSEQALRKGKLPDATRTYEDLGVVVYNLNGPNKELAQHLVNQAKERGVEVKFPMAFYHLKTIKDDRFPDGLRFDLDDIAVAYHVPVLSQNTGNFDANDSELVKSGFPSELGKGNRKLYTAQEGLRRLFRDGDLDLGAKNGYLPSSAEAGRVSFVKKGEAPQNLEARLAELKKEKDIQIAEIEARYGKALEIMKG